MILITLGTQDKSFERLLKKVDELIDKKIICEEVIVQAGFTKYESKNMKVFDLIPKEDFDSLVKESKYIISHGGVGTILTALNNNKKVIGVARLKKYKEHVNDHQIQLIENFSKAGYIIGVDDLDNLGKFILQVSKFKPKKYKGEVQRMNKTIEKEIEKYSSRQTNIIVRILFFLSLIFCIYLLVK